MGALNMAQKLKGHCQCGAIAFEVEGPPKWVAHCHCADCRKATGAAMSTYVGCHRDTVTFTKGEPKPFASSKGVKRSHCANCGSPISFEGERWAGEIHFFVGLFEHPEDLVPEGEAFKDEKLPWLHLAGPGTKPE
jgi:hypothetical protein